MTYKQVIELKDVLIAKQQSEKQSDVSKYTRWQQLKVGLPSVKHQTININCKNKNEIFRQPRWTYEEQIQTTNALAESVLIPQQKLRALTPTPQSLNNDQAPPGGAW